MSHVMVKKNHRTTSSKAARVPRPIAVLILSPQLRSASPWEHPHDVTILSSDHAGSVGKIREKNLHIPRVIPQWSNGLVV
jgi:hypothetical protein